MQVELMERTTYDIKVGGKIVKGFTMVSRWEGLVKLQDPKGRFIILPEVNGLTKVFSDLFGENTTKGLTVIAGAMDLLKELAEEPVEKA